MSSENENSARMPIVEAVELEAGKRFHRLTVHKWRRSGRLTCCIQIGREWYCTRQDVAAMLIRDSQQTPSEPRVERRSKSTKP